MMTMPMEAGKWSRNLNEEVINESNRSRLIEKQRQLLETKRTRQQQVTVTSTRPKSARNLRPASSLSRSSEKLLDNRDITVLGGIINPASSQSTNDDDYDDDENEFDNLKNHSVRQGSQSRTSNKLSGTLSPSMSPIEGTMKGRNSSSSTPTSTSTTTVNRQSTTSRPQTTNTTRAIIEKQSDGENNHGDGNGSISSPGNSDKELSPVSDSKSISNKSGTDRRQVFLLGGRRRKKSKTYVISNDPFDITRDNCIAKLKSNVLGTLFNAVRISGEGQRYEISSVIYETNVLGFKGPRKMTVIIPKNDEVCPYPNSSLMELWKADPANKSLVSLKNKTPVWNEDTQSYVLNFHGRVTQPSVKNFQLAVAKKGDVNSDIDDLFYSENNKGGDKLSPTTRSSTPTFFPTNPAPTSGSIGQLDDDIAMQFGRISDKEFTCDVTWPLSILQAFCVALSSFDSKLACE